MFDQPSSGLLRVRPALLARRRRRLAALVDIGLGTGRSLLLERLLLGQDVLHPLEDLSLLRPAEPGILDVLLRQLVVLDSRERQGRQEVARDLLEPLLEILGREPLAGDLVDEAVLDREGVAEAVDREAGLLRRVPGRRALPDLGVLALTEAE